MAEGHGHQLSEHHAHCFVCGTHDDRGLVARQYRDGDRIVLRFLSDERHQGAPGFVHGGVTAALLDEALGTVPGELLDKPASVTGELTIRYRNRAVIGREIVAEAWVERVEGRKLHLAGTAHVGATLVAEARGTFIELRAEA